MLVVNKITRGIVQKLFEKLSEDGKVHHTFEKQFWGGWHGNFSDKFGIKWMVNYTPPQP